MPLTHITEQVDAMAVLIRRLFFVVKVLGAVLFVTVAILVVLEIQVARRNNDIDRVEESAKRAETSSDTTYVLLRGALDAQQGSPGAAEAIARIERIEAGVGRIEAKVDQLVAQPGG